MLNFCSSEIHQPVGVVSDLVIEFSLNDQIASIWPFHRLSEARNLCSLSPFIDPIFPFLVSHAFFLATLYLFGIFPCRPFLSITFPVSSSALTPIPLT